jgi:hypothetical protein
MTAATYATGYSTPIVGGTTGLSNKHMPVCIQKYAFDTSTFTGTTTQSLNIMTIPAKTALIFLEVLIGAAALTLAGTPAVSVGDSGNTTLYVNAASTFTAGLALTQAVTTMPLKYYSTADKLTLTLTGGSTFPGTGIIHFTVGFIDCNYDLAMTT